MTESAARSRPIQRGEPCVMNAKNSNKKSADTALAGQLPDALTKERIKELIEELEQKKKSFHPTLN
jgi:hypothetical protein